MKYWAHINNVVCGPYEKEKLAEQPGFTVSSLLCPESAAGEEANAWKAASSYPEVLAALSPAPAPAQPKKPAAESPLLMTMRGTLIEEPVVKDPVPEPPKEKPAAGFSVGIPPASVENARRPDPQPEPLAQKLEQMSAMLVSIGNSQAQLLERLGRVESSVAAMKSLLFPAPPK